MAINLNIKTNQKDIGRKFKQFQSKIFAKLLCITKFACRYE